MIYFNDLTERLNKLNKNFDSKKKLDGENFFKKGLEVSKDGKVWKRTNANDDTPNMAEQTDSSKDKKLALGIANKLKKSDPQLYEDITKTDDTDCDIRPSKKYEHVYGIFRDGEKDPADVFHA